MFTKILCPVDFSDASALVGKTAREFAVAFNAEVLLLHVVPSLMQYEVYDLPSSSLPQLAGNILAGAEKSMEAFVSEHFSGLRAEGKVVRGDAAGSIITTAEAENADIIIMGTHGRQGLNRLLFGSVAEKVVKTSPVPVLTIRPYA